MSSAKGSSAKGSSAAQRRGEAKFGVSGWDYADWRGPLYPSPLPKGFRALPLLARFTRFMEVNVSYYRILPQSASLRWVDETPSDFTFVFKAWRGWTHERGAQAGAVSGQEDEIGQFRDLVAPAAQAGRLDGILVQFPPSLSDPNEALSRLCALRDALAPHRIFAEFRHHDLYRDSLLRELESEQIAFVNVDLPAVRTLPTLSRINTGPVSYLRLHGRNRAGWERQASRDDRYDHSYSETEVAELTGVIDELLGRCPQVLVGANNHFGGQAAAVVAQLRSAIEGVPCSVPARLRTAFPAVGAVTVDLPEVDPPEVSLAPPGTAPSPDASSPTDEMSLDLGPPPRT